MKIQQLFRYVLIGFLVISLSYFGLVRSPSVDHAALSGPFSVQAVIDGDTIDVLMDYKKTRIRLIGIDTPEHDEPYFEQATDFTASLVSGRDVYLEYDEDHIDKYGRTLAYVYLDDQTTCVNAEIMRAGWAELLIIDPNDLHEVLLRRALRDAVFNQRGMY